MKTLKIQWQVGNQCNFRCGYCHHDYHDGSNPFLDHETFNRAFSNLKESVVNHDRVILEMLGGEPTISKSVREAIANPQDPKFRFNITSNGSADLDWWSRAAPNLDIVILAWHHLGNTDHFLQVLDLLSATHDCTRLVPIINALPDDDKWAEAVYLHETLKAKGFSSKIKILFANHNQGNDKFMRYNQDQVVYYCRENNIRIPSDPLKYSLPAMEASLYTEYKSHLCWAGVDQVVIDYFGYVYRGWCMVGNSYGNIFDKPVVLDASPRVCTRLLCKNGFDQQAKKSEKSWGL